MHINIIIIIVVVVKPLPDSPEGLSVVDFCCNVKIIGKFFNPISFSITKFIVFAKSLSWTLDIWNCVWIFWSDIIFMGNASNRSKATSPGFIELLNPGPFVELSLTYQVTLYEIKLGFRRCGLYGAY